MSWADEDFLFGLDIRGLESNTPVLWDGLDFDQFLTAWDDTPQADAAHQESSIEAQQRLQQERIDNESPSLLFSRACGVCYFAHPKLRAVYIKCGHIVCGPCAEEQSLDGPTKCPFCRADGGYIRLREEEKEAVEQDSNEEKQ